MSLTFHSSNRLENLAKIFADNYRCYQTSPFDKEVIVVQTKGMEKWLALQIASFRGISANNDFLFPNTIVQRLFKSVLDYESLQLAFDKDSLLWEIYCQLPLLCETEPSFAPVKRYLSEDQNGVKRYQLSEKIADIFDQYQVYRPEMVRDWDNGDYWLGREGVYDTKHAWQPILWTRIFGETDQHRASVYARFMTNISHLQAGQIDRLPTQISIFGISVIPKMYLNILTAVSSYIPVDYYTLNPCQEYWGYIRNRKEIKRFERAVDKSAEELRLEEGNLLLASQGVLGREFIDMMLEIPLDFDTRETFIPEQKETLLSTLQNDMLYLVDVESIDDASFVSETVERLIGDQTVSIYSCHSKMREIEVLYDNLIHMTQKMPDLTPSDILVISPDIYGYAPYISAVFDHPADERLRLPYAIADVPYTREFGLIEAFMDTLKLMMSRFKASEVLALLDVEAVRKQFNLTVDHVTIIEKWVDEAGIRWGIDESTVVDNGLPLFDLFSFKKGIRRLLLGYSMRSEDDQFVENDYIYCNFDENDSIILGYFLDFLDVLVRYASKISTSRSFTEWNEVLSELIGELFFAAYPFDDAHLFLQQLVGQLQTNEAALKNEIIASVDTVKQFIWKKYGENVSSNPFISGGVTFCAMIPMRSIPFRVICMVGMNDGSFPRQKQPMEFDLMQEQRYLGDRSPRDSDRYLFLETLISARDVLYMSYVGQNIRDNNEIPPSVLVNEIIDYIDVRFQLTKSDRDKLVTQHRLQAFNRSYFSEKSTLMSYSLENEQICTSSYLGEKRQHLFFDSTLSEVPLQQHLLEMDELVAFFKHPVKALYHNRLGIYLADQNSFVKDEEMFLPDNLERYQLRSDFISTMDLGIDSKNIEGALQSFGRLPVGNVGQYYLNTFQSETTDFLNRLAPYRQGDKPSFSKHLKISDGVTLNIVFSNIFKHHQLFYRGANLTDKDILQGWLYHLAGCLISDVPDETVVAGIDKIIRFGKVEDAQSHLKTLVDVYFQGVTNPLHFFPSFSMKYTDAKGDKLNQMKQLWDKSPFDGAADRYYQHCFNHTSPIDDDFIQLAELITIPLKASMETVWSHK